MNKYIVGHPVRFHCSYNRRVGCLQNGRSAPSIEAEGGGSLSVMAVNQKISVARPRSTSWTRQPVRSLEPAFEICFRVPWVRSFKQIGPRRRKPCRRDLQPPGPEQSLGRRSGLMWKSYQRRAAQIQRPISEDTDVRGKGCMWQKGFVVTNEQSKVLMFNRGDGALMSKQLLTALFEAFSWKFGSLSGRLPPFRLADLAWKYCANG
jgi:hypothetical protein